MTACGGAGTSADANGDASPVAATSSATPAEPTPTPFALTASQPAASSEAPGGLEAFKADMTALGYAHTADDPGLVAQYLCTMPAADYSESFVVTSDIADALKVSAEQNGLC